MNIEWDFTDEVMETHPHTVVYIARGECLDTGKKFTALYDVTDNHFQGDPYDIEEE